MLERIRKARVVAVSGGFDPLHPGHLALFEAAAGCGPLCVIVNNDGWLMRKKGYVFQSLEDRIALINACRMVFAVMATTDEADSVCSTLELIKPAYFANGGDRTVKNVPEIATCTRLGIDVLWNMGGGKNGSSRELVAAACRRLNDLEETRVMM